jgi:hypothetical protein
MSHSPSKLRLLRRVAFIGEIVGCVLAFGFGLTSDSSGMPFMIAGLCVLALSFLLWLYCRRVEQRASTVQHSHENAAS